MGGAPQRQRQAASEMVRKLDPGARLDQEQSSSLEAMTAKQSYDRSFVHICVCVHTQDTYIWRPEGNLICSQRHPPSLFFLHRVPHWPGSHKWAEWLASKLQGSTCLHLPNIAHDHTGLLPPLSMGSRDRTWILQLSYFHSPKKTYF